ncbi:hypothetical protein MLD38_022364 [Melastoma candidum]|uniref:Uncharacterized protein n=1 Tax=Melastoma candidum TaxID=119954 RepID=A0ACB9QIC4_9MYRT|nr:hypothetical protein MLD38_022364 [Melastoma candidum]
MASSSFLYHKSLLLLVVVGVVVLQGFLRQACTGAVIEYLPGLEGPLPFELETGYVGVGEEEQIQLFYYFIKSERDPERDPILLWLTGGPGCSALSGLIYEIGPLNFKIKDYGGSFPELVVNQDSWTKASSIIFVDSPVGTGFSYAENESAYQTGDRKQISDLHQFLRKWLIQHPDFLPNEVYIGGDSYSGFIIPVLVQEIIKGNVAGEKPFTNIQGYVLGNPGTDSATDSNAAIPFAHGMGLISDELYQSLRENCKGNYLGKEFVSQQCSDDLAAYRQSVSGIQFAQILEPLCGFALRQPSAEIYRNRRDLLEKNFLIKVPSDLSCRTYQYTFSYTWSNNIRVRDALHIREGSIGSWERCSTRFKYTNDIPSVLQHHVELSQEDIRSLIYSGDHDMIIPFLGTQAWIRSLNYSIVDDWRSWVVEGQVGGYTRTYSNNMTFATVKGGGHTAPEYKPKECSAMYKRWVSRESL